VTEDGDRQDGGQRPAAPPSPPSPRVAVPLPVPLAPLRRRLGLVADFASFELLVTLGWDWPMRRFQAVLVALVALATPLVASVSLAASSVGAAYARHLGGGRARPSDAAAIAVLALAAEIYVAVVYAFREVFSRRRHLVSDSPNQDFYRALDLRAADVFLVYCAARIVVVGWFALLAAAGFALGMRGVLGGEVLVTLTVSPVLLTVALLGLSAAAARTPPAPVRGRWAAAGVFAFAFGSAYAVVRAVRGAVHVVPGTSTPVSGRVDMGTAVLLGLCVASATAGAIALARGVRTLGRASFELHPAPPPRDHPRRGAGPGTAPRGLLVAQALWLQLWAMSTARVLRRVIGAQLLVIAALAGAVCALGGSPLLPGGPAGVIERGVLFVGYLLSSVTTETVHSAVGPARTARHLRSAWENLLGMREIVVGAAAVYSAVPLAVGLLAMGWTWAATGRVVPDVVVLALSVGWAATIADSVAAVPRELVDGSTQPSLFTALLAVMISVPQLLLLTVTDAWTARAAAYAYLLALLGGALGCLRSRIMALRFVSAA